MRKKKKYELEYSMNTSPEILYTRLSSPGGLSEWFADNVNLDGNLYTFFWSKTREQAKVLIKKENKLIRFHWMEDKDSKSYFRIQKLQRMNLPVMYLLLSLILQLRTKKKIPSISGISKLPN